MCGMKHMLAMGEGFIYHGKVCSDSSETCHNKRSHTIYHTLSITPHHTDCVPLHGNYTVLVKHALEIVFEDIIICLLA